MTAEHDRMALVKVDGLRLYDKARASFPAQVEAWTKALDALDPKGATTDTAAGELSAQIAKGLKLAERMKDTELAPLEVPLKEMEGWWSPITKSLKDLGKRAKAIAADALAYKRVRENEERVKRERELEEARKKERELEQQRLAAKSPAADAAHKEALGDLRRARVAIEDLPPAGAPTAIRTESGTLFPREEWDYEVITISEVPAMLLKVDDVRVREQIERGVREIPGLRIFPKNTMVQRTK